MTKQTESNLVKVLNVLAKEPNQACKEALAETQEPVHTNGDRTMSMKDRNFTSEGNGYIQDINFDFDAGLRIGGDFVNDERDQYAQMICNALNTTPPKEEPQEPVAWIITNEYGNNDCAIIDSDKADHFKARGDCILEPLYTTPSREWQSLSDDEIGRLAVFDGLHHVEIPLLAKFIIAIEQALKEKNNGT